MLNKIGLKHGTDKATYHKYLDFYEWHLPDRRAPVTLLEIGVKQGASLKTWAEYFYWKSTKIFGLDINEPLRFSDKKIHCLQGNAASMDCLLELSNSYPHFDIIIDDGSHMTADQQATFTFFYPLMRSGDIYIIEDIHTSNWTEYRNTALSTEEYVRTAVPGWQIFTYHNEEHAGDSQTMLIIKP